MGFAMGIDFRESSLLISAKTEETARKGMVFNLNIGVSGLTNKSQSRRLHTDERFDEYFDQLF